MRTTSPLKPLKEWGSIFRLCCDYMVAILFSKLSNAMAVCHFHCGINVQKPLLLDARLEFARDSKRRDQNVMTLC